MNVCYMRLRISAAFIFRNPASHTTERTSRRGGLEKSKEISSRRGRRHLDFWLVLTERVRGTSQGEGRVSLSSFYNHPSCGRVLDISPFALKKYQLIVSGGE